MLSDEQRIAEGEQFWMCIKQDHRVKSYIVPLDSKRAKLLYECFDCERLYWNGATLTGSFQSPMESSGIFYNLK